LLLAVAAPDAPKICEALRQANIPVCPVGEVTERQAEAVLGLLSDGTQRALSGGFQHFS
jgi:hydrogenase maturation factor